MDLIAVVTGASRGAGKGIAIALGEAGATVYVTGRSVADSDSLYGGTVSETADLVTQAGGNGVAIALDHTDDKAVAALFERVKAEHGRLDILVNNAAKLVAAPSPGGFWEKPLEAVDLITVGLRSHFVAAYYAAPLLIANGRGLIVNTSYYGSVSYHSSGPAYGAQKAGADKMAADMAKELRPYNIAAVSIWMGPLDTERARAYLASLPKRCSAKDIDVKWLEGVSRVGLTAGASAPEVLVEQVSERLAEFGFTDQRDLDLIDEDVRFTLPPELATIAPAPRR